MDPEDRKDIRSAIGQITDIIDNAGRVRGERFSVLLRVAINFSTIEKLTSATAPPKAARMIEEVLGNSYGMLLDFHEITDAESDELKRLLDTVSDTGAQFGDRLRRRHRPPSQ